MYEHNFIGEYGYGYGYDEECPPPPPPPPSLLGTSNQFRYLNPNPRNPGAGYPNRFSGPEARGYARPPRLPPPPQADYYYNPPLPPPESERPPPPPPPPPLMQNAYRSPRPARPHFEESKRYFPRHQEAGPRGFRPRFPQQSQHRPGFPHKGGPRSFYPAPQHQAQFEDFGMVRRTFVHDTVPPLSYHIRNESKRNQPPETSNTISMLFSQTTQPPPSSAPEATAKIISPPVLPPPGEEDSVQNGAETEETENGSVDASAGDVTYASSEAPLAPPPMPPMFSWDSTPFKPPESLTEFKVSPSLPFVPVPAEKIDLNKMAKELEHQRDIINNDTITKLELQGVISPLWPKELTSMFQPLFCKLCTLTLSSPIVAADHYKGRKHKKCIEKWLADSRAEQSLGIRNQGPSFQAKPSNAKPPPITGSNTIPLGLPVPAGMMKRPYNPGSNYNNSNKKFPLGRPPAKKPKSDPNAGPNYGFCAVCQIALTSKPHSDQHYAGKLHQKKAAEGGRQLGRTGPPPPPAPPPPRFASRPVDPNHLYSAAPRPLLPLSAAHKPFF